MENRQRTSPIAQLQRSSLYNWSKLHPLLTMHDGKPCRVILYDERYYTGTKSKTREWFFKWSAKNRSTGYIKQKLKDSLVAYSQNTDEVEILQNLSILKNI